MVASAKKQLEKIAHFMLNNASDLTFVRPSRSKTTWMNSFDDDGTVAGAGGSVVGAGGGIIGIAG